MIKLTVREGRRKSPCAH